MNPSRSHALPQSPCCLFVCTGNYYRSRFAEAVFNHSAEARNLGWRAFSRGLAIDQVGPTAVELSPFTKSALLARSIPEYCTGPLRVQVGTTDFEHADRIIVLDEIEHRPMMALLFPEWESRVDYWRVADLHAATVEEALPSIERHVHALILDLGSSHPAGSRL